MKIGFIGTGNMAQAIIHGLLEKQLVAKEEIYVSSGHYENARQFAGKTGVNACQNNQEVAQEADIIVLAVKPKIIEKVLMELRDYRKQQLFISIAAGKSLQVLEEALDSQAAIVRVMPNVNVSVGAGVSAICKNKGTTEEQFKQAMKIFEAIGSVYPLAEEDFSTFIGLAGSSPAFIYMLIDAMGRAGVLHGLPKQTATEIAAKAILGSCEKFLVSDKNPWELVDQVSSPGGTTVAGVVALEEAGFIPAIIKGITTTIEKDKEMM
ncbi:pyrroline-5-carboxylate reductase [Enterococcus sp. 10A9_DIV0425]|uniref:Pyrroline-5-carboxylate reductase n=2 Tax=Candidatus Enterococcus wittei TaxID=1987383 RepID=A0A242JWL8_9ENTE|nr:pyrroline-5-carboxylate reductase [Enterococcus sp. 10A9_DIV0425]THE15872.1 pyrroline-5-carboxylate reductase [Enterococcus hirae]